MRLPCAPRNDAAVQADHSVEFFLNPPQHVDVLFEGVGVERRHDAAFAQVVSLDQAQCDPQLVVFPPALFQPLDATNDQVRPEPPAVLPRRQNGAIAGCEQRQNIEALGPIKPNQSRPWSCCRFHIASHGLGPPTAAIDHWLTIRPKGRPVAQQTGSRPCGEKPPPPALRVNDAVTFNPILGHHGTLQPFARHRLHWIAPNLLQVPSRHFLEAASTLKVGSAPNQVTSAVGP